MFSAYNDIYHRYFHFDYDAFTILKVGASFEKSSIELFNHEVGKKGGFKRAASL